MWLKQSVEKKFVFSSSRALDPLVLMKALDSLLTYLRINSLYPHVLPSPACTSGQSPSLEHWSMARVSCVFLLWTVLDSAASPSLQLQLDTSLLSSMGSWSWNFLRCRNLSSDKLVAPGYGLVPLAPCFLLSFITASYAWTHVIRTPASIQCSVRTVAAVDDIPDASVEREALYIHLLLRHLEKPWFLFYEWFLIEVCMFVLCCETLDLPEAFGWAFFLLTLFWQGKWYCLALSGRSRSCIYVCFIYNVQGF